MLLPDQRKLYCHKVLIILSISSKVFASIFETKSEEICSFIIRQVIWNQASNCDLIVISQRFIYRLKNNVFQVYAAAKKYEIKDLESAIEKSLYEAFKLENYGQIFEFLAYFEIDIFSHRTMFTGQESIMKSIPRTEVL